ncbi:MAG: hypothetical protein EAZ09_03620 [Oscillatoriales cyanobacterium]|nr:MAG: hypothetical protein EAZ18_00905 [Oscillatoriales cyanobacterium]TAH24594.1 MAG: hypothetical protein EAZ09_03620 [Oscillatoriales cyanobacterium]
MTQEQNQQPKVNLGTSDENTELEQPTLTAEELPNVNSKTPCQAFATSGEDRLKALARLIIVSFAWSIPELSERKYSNRQGN